MMLFIGTSACFAALAQQNDLPARRGFDAHWLSAAKNGFGTSTTLDSKIWFTLTDGVLSEVFFPTIDMPNVECLQLIIVTPSGKVETELNDTVHSLVPPNGRSLSFSQTNSAKSGAYAISKTYVTDPKRSSLVMRVQFNSSRGDSGQYKVYVYYDPSLNNSGMHDSGWTENNELFASDGDKVSALVSKPAFVESTNGYLGTNDGLVQLQNQQTLQANQMRAENGNVVQVARPGSLTRSNNSISFTLSLGFAATAELAGKTARESLTRNFEIVRKEYDRGWQLYTSHLPKVTTNHQRQLNMAAMVLRALEDKTYRGAFIASPSTPWGGGPNSNEPTTSGYHAVWARDLYQVATAFIALGDLPSANRALNYVFNVQQRADGGVPQNSWVDGRPIGGGSQLDEVALPIVLAYQLQRFDRASWSQHLKPAADFLVHNGPATNQERWEEKSGYSPATIAAEIAGLVCAAQVAQINGDHSGASNYLRTADEWAQRVAEWTATSNGPLGDGHYYLRIAPTGKPDQSTPLEINSGGGSYDQREIVDAGFLELVRLGIKSAEDPLIKKSVNVVDRLIRLESRAGAGWYRYNHDAYGEQSNGHAYDARNGIGRLWTLLTGERGEYEIAAGRLGVARRHLDTMGGFANDGLMIPEQVWDRGSASGTGTGSATPLAWSMAQFIRLSMNIARGINTDTPTAVSYRYLRRKSAG